MSDYFIVDENDITNTVVPPEVVASFVKKYLLPQPEPNMADNEEGPWPFEQADSLSYHLSGITDRLHEEVRDEDVVAAISTLDQIRRKTKELRRELMDIPVPSDVDEPSEEA